MFDSAAFAATVQENCHISDARFAGHYTLCIYLLKMREYYRWEHGIGLTQPLPGKAVGEWLTEREAHWDRVESLEFHPLEIDGERLDPFDSEAINQRLLPAGFVYSAGYGVYHKPCFFFAELERIERHDAATLFISGKEHARDLAAPPAMLQGQQIFVRRESLRRFIWEKLEELGQKTETPMARALACYAGSDLETTLDLMSENEIETLILHEIGESQAQDILGDAWQTLLLSLPRSRGEFLLRGVRDNLADCLSTLPTLLARDNEAALHFYFTNFTGMRKELFPAAWDAYHDWLQSGNLAALKTVAARGRDHWQQVALDILQAHAANEILPESDIEHICQIL